MAQQERQQKIEMQSGDAGWSRFFELFFDLIDELDQVQATNERMGLPLDTLTTLPERKAA